MSKKPDSATVDAWIGLHAVSRRLLERVEKDLRNAKLPPLSWYDILLEIERAGNVPLRQGELGERLLLAKHGISRLVDRLEREGLVTRHTCPEDQRAQFVTATAVGRKMLRRMWAVYGASLERHFGARLAAGQAAALRDLLAPLRND
jgi:DNA-binding MarR family transcriptional regulator